MKTVRIAAGVCILALTVGPAGAAPAPVQERRDVSQATTADRIVYSSRNCRGMEDYGEAGCTFEIFSVDLDGSAPKQILDTYGTDDVFPAYSPDGTEIAFNSWDKVWGCDSHLWLMGADGSNPHMISSPHNAWDETFAWAPNGDIAFTRWPNDPACNYGKHSDVYLLSREGQTWSQEPLLTRTGRESYPAFSPNGRRIAYEYDRDDDGIYDENDPEQIDIWVSSADGSGPHIRLTRSRLREADPAWSPDGRWIAFFRGKTSSVWMQDGWGQIWLMRPDGSDKHRLTPSGALDATPAWSPDGTRIAFSRCRPIGLQYDCAIAMIRVARPNRVKMIVDRESYMDVMPSWAPAP